LRHSAQQISSKDTSKHSAGDREELDSQFEKMLEIHQELKIKEGCC
jgi:hypothetical protein